MAGRGPQSFKKRQKEQQRKEKQQEKFARRLQRKLQDRTSLEPDQEVPIASEGEESKRVPEEQQDGVRVDGLPPG